jgi:TonB family protein
MQWSICFLLASTLFGYDAASQSEKVDVLPRIVSFATLPDSLLSSFQEPAGLVIVRARVDSVGAPTNISVDGSNAESLEAGAIEAVRHSRFIPALRGDQPVGAWVQIPIRFVRVDTLGITFMRMLFDQGLDPSDTARFTPPVIDKQVAPEYPKQALFFGEEARVVVKLQIDHTGKVVQAAILKSTNEQFNDPSLHAAWQLVFTPARFDGVPIGVAVAFPFRFRIGSPNSTRLRRTAGAGRN